MTIRDGMSAKLKRITSAFQKMERAARSADKATQAVNPGRTLENSASLIDRARKRLDAFINRQRDAGKGAEEVSDAWSRTEGLIKKALAVFSVAAVKGQIQKALEEFSNQYNAEVQLGVVMKNAGMDQKAFDAIRDRASALESKTTFGGDTFVAGAAELGTYLKDPEALSAAMGTLANYAAGMGGPSVDQSQMVEYATQLGKALDGTYDGLKKKGFELTEAQQKIIETGTDMEKVAVINDVINQSWKGLAESYANTPTGKIEQFKNKIGQLYEAAGQKLVGGVMRLLTAVTNLLDTLQNTGALDGVCVVLNVIMGLLGYAATAVSWIAQVVVDNWPTVSAILTAIAIVLLPAMISRLLATAAAWALANAPLIMMIALVALLISAAMDAGATIEDVVGFVGGLLGGLYAFGYNLIADIWNFIATFAEFFANVFVDPIGSIERLFLGLADSVLGVLETIANAIDAVFGSSLSDAVGNWRSGLQAKIEASYGENAVRYDRMEKIDTASTAAAWSTGAKGIANNLSQITGKLDSLTSSWDVSRSTGTINGGVLDSVGSVGKIDSDVNIADEDLKFLRDVAEMRYVQNFVTLTPTVAMDAQISERVDLDDVVSAIERKLEGEFIAAAEGVYN
jgi:hypothetical protein